MNIPNNPNKEEINKRITLSLNLIIKIIDEITNITNKIIDKKPKGAGMVILNPIAIQYRINIKTNPNIVN